MLQYVLPYIYAGMIRYYRVLCWTAPGVECIRKCCFINEYGVKKNFKKKSINRFLQCPLCRFVASVNRFLLSNYEHFCFNVRSTFPYKTRSENDI